MPTQIKRMLQLFALTLLTVTPRVAKADDDLKDDSRRDAHDMKRAVKKAGDRVAEAACTGTDAECAAERARHRHWEAKRRARDRAEESKAQVEERTK